MQAVVAKLLFIIIITANDHCPRKSLNKNYLY